MASGDKLGEFGPAGAEPLSAANNARPDWRNNHPVLDFQDATANEEANWTGHLNGYGGGGLTVTVIWSAETATTGNVKWDVQIESHTDDADDLDTDSFAAEQTVTATTATVSGEVDYANITFTNGAQMDSLADGEQYRIKVIRDQADAADTMTGDAELHRVVVKET